MNIRYLSMAIGLIATLSLSAHVAFASNLSAQDFVTKASIANKFEIESSKLALKKTQNDDVKSFAQRMVDDHGKVGDKLKEVLQSSDSTIKPADELDHKHQKLLDKLEAASGDSFDRQYVSIQTDAHKEAVSLFSHYSKHGKDKALKDFATETLPTLKAHLEHVQKLKASQ